MGNVPRVRRMVLFKHGIAHLERGGSVSGSFELAFSVREMKDVLKSLAVWLPTGDARVLGIGFDAPEDPQAALAARKLAFEPGEALFGLLTASRGKRVRITKRRAAEHEGRPDAADDEAHTVVGEVVGLDETKAPHGATRRVLVLRTAEDALALVDVASITALVVEDPSARSDLGFLVDRLRAIGTGENRRVRVQLSGASSDARVAYAVPAPVWRVSYRLLRSADSCSLMAFGIVHNPAEEDLEDVELTLTTGQPVSFEIDLYGRKEVTRARVEERPRVAAAPKTAPPPPPAPMRVMASRMPMAAAPAGGAPEMYAMAMEESFEAAATGEERGDFFEYRVSTPVTLSRGGSAMVPLLTERIEAIRERVFREGDGPAPDLELRFVNTTGAVLEEGAVVVYDEGSYAGEAMLPFSARGVDVRLPFAKDLAIRCSRRTQERTVVVGVRFGERGLAEERRRESWHTLRVESDHGTEVDVYFELPKRHGATLDPDHFQAADETGAVRRFCLRVPGRHTIERIAVERWKEESVVVYDRLDRAAVARYFEERFLDRATFEALGSVLAMWDQARELDEKREALEREQKSAHSRQKKVVEQLGVLKDAGEEGALRLRFVRELEQEQDRLNTFEQEIRRLRDAAHALRRSAQDALAQLARR